jgi:hypothetical protein
LHGVTARRLRCSALRLSSGSTGQPAQPSALGSLPRAFARRHPPSSREKTHQWPFLSHSGATSRIPVSADRKSNKINAGLAISQPISIRKASAWRPFFPSQHLTVLHVGRIFPGNACTSSSASTLASAENSNHRDRTGQSNTAANLFWIVRDVRDCLDPETTFTEAKGPANRCPTPALHILD